MDARPIHGGAIAFLVLLALGLPLGALGVSIRAVSDRRWRDLDQATHERADRLRSRDARRPVLRGEGVSGNAWDDYERSNSLLKNQQAYWRLSDFEGGRGDLSREEAEALLEQFLPSLEAARQGSRRTEYSRMLAWDAPSHLPFRSSQQATLGLLRARFLAEQGDGRAAVELLLDLMQVLQDAGRGGSWWEVSSSLYHQERMLVQLEALMAAGLLGRSELCEIARELGAVDQALPAFGEGMLNWAMIDGFQVLRTGSAERFLKEFRSMEKTPSAWRFGFSDRLLLAKFVDLEQRLAERIAEGDGRPWPEARERTIAACEELAAARHPFLWDGNLRSSQDYLRTQRYYREAVVHLRLVRAAAQYRADGVVPELGDPFGGALKWGRSGPLLRLWSVGWDGVDHGGRGGWKGRAGQDIVLVVRRQVRGQGFFTGLIGGIPRAPRRSFDSAMSSIQAVKPLGPACW